MLDLLVVLVLLVDSKQNETVQKAVSFFRKKKLMNICIYRKIAVPLHSQCKKLH